MPIYNFSMDASVEASSEEDAMNKIQSLFGIDGIEITFGPDEVLPDDDDDDDKD